MTTLIKNPLFQIATVFSLLIISCVPARKFEEEQSLKQKYLDSLKLERTGGKDCKTKFEEEKAKTAELSKKVNGLEKDTTIIGTNYRNLTSKYDKLNQVNEQLLAQLSKITQNSANENAQLMTKLQYTQEDLQKKEDELKKLQIELDIKKKNLDQLQKELLEREKRIHELEDILKKKENAIHELKKTVSDALVGFEGKGLTVTQKNGKVYVSMDESLLFSTGSTKVDPKGVSALKELAKVLEKNPDINVMVEGHTDDQPMKGTGDIKDNWDLSVMRATSVVKILLSSAKIDEKRITAGGRGEFLPIDPSKTSEARKKNRRTEIILTPKLDDLLKLLESN